MQEITLKALHTHGIVEKEIRLERLERMKAVNIKLSLTENVKTFVNIVSRYPYDVDLRAGRHVVDAKSILGIFSLDLSKPVTVEV